MMRKNQYKYVRTVLCGCFLVLTTMTGCGVQDSAVVIPFETEDAEVNPADIYTEEDTGGLTENGEAEDNIAGIQRTIWIYVCGEVVNPGVYELPANSRINDALDAAGGFTANAAKEYINLAAKVSDGEKLYFPTVSEAEELRLVEVAEQQGLVNINTASVLRLMQLPGIGESKAQAIVAYREKNGNFQRKEDLMKVPGIKENIYVKLSDKIIVQ